MVGLVFSSPSLKRSHLVYVPCPLGFALSHFLLMDISPTVLLGGGGLSAACTFAQSAARLRCFCAVAGLCYGFVASLLHLLVKEFFGLLDLTRLQPVVFGAMIVGEMMGMALPGVLYDVYGSYAPSLIISLGASAVTVLCFLVMRCKHPLEVAREASPMATRTPAVRLM